MNVSTVEQKDQTEDWYLSSYEEFEKHLDGRAEDGLQELRSRSLEQFQEAGFPTKQLEEWKYTSTRAIRNNRFHYLTDREPAESLTEQDIEPFRIPDLDVNRLVFVNGFLAEDLTSTPHLPEEVLLTDLADALQSHRDLVDSHLGQYANGDEYPFAALNTAFLQHGAVLHVPDNIVVEDPIHILHITSTEEDYGVHFPRNLFLVGENSEVSIIEQYTGTTDAVYFSDTVTELVADRNSSVDHYKLQKENDASYQVTTLESHQAEDASVRQTNIHFGSRWTRNDINATLDGEGGDCSLNGLFCTNEQQHVDNHTRLYHMQPNCDSYELYTGVLDDESTGVFNGTIFVHKRAQRTSSNQHNNNLLLTNDATINTKPELEIFADDVTCSHGATIGQLEERARYYLRTRGIDEELAEEILINAFARDLTDRIRIEPLRKMVNGTFFSRRDSDLPEMDS